MSRHSQDREDLLRDATAYERRIELELPREDRLALVFIGIRDCGAMSFYFDGDPVYHFNSSGHLRRAFVKNQLVKSQQGRLLGWLPRRDDTQVEMECQQIQEEEFMRSMQQKLHFLQTVLARGDFRVVGQVPPEEDLVAEINTRLPHFQNSQIAASPHVS